MPNSNPNQQKEPPKNDWQSYNNRGMRDVVKERVSKEKMPDFVKAFIIAEIDGLPADCVGAEVNGYGITHEAPHNITRSINITVVGIKL
jgi:hypothetical protein